MNALIHAHLTAILASLSTLAVAIICTMPSQPPGFLSWAFTQEMWTWMRDALQTVVPAARNQHTTVSSTVQTPTTSSHVEATVVNPTDPK